MPGYNARSALPEVDTPKVPGRQPCLTAQLGLGSMAVPVSTGWEPSIWSCQMTWQRSPQGISNRGGGPGGGWAWKNPFEKYAHVKIGSFPQGWKSKIFETTTWRGHYISNHWECHVFFFPEKSLKSTRTTCCLFDSPQMDKLIWGCSCWCQLMWETFLKTDWTDELKQTDMVNWLEWKTIPKSCYIDI